MPTDPSPEPIFHLWDLWEWFMAGLLTILSALLGIIWTRNNEDRQHTEDALKEVASKEDLKAVNLIAADAVRQDEYEQNRQEVRADMIAIHTKLDRLRDDVHASHTAIIAAIATVKNGNGR